MTRFWCDICNDYHGVCPDCGGAVVIVDPKNASCTNCNKIFTNEEVENES